MESQKMTTQNYFKAIQIVHIAFIIGLVFFGLVSFLLQSQGFGSIGQEINNIALAIIPIVAIGGVIGSSLAFKRKLNNCLTKTTLHEKLADYRSALIIKYAIIEGAAFITIISYLITGDLILLGIAGLLIIIFITFRPSKEKLFIELELSHPERELLNNPDTEIDIK